MKVVLHVGLQKTGSTVLQESVFPNLVGVAYTRYLQRDLIYGDFGSAHTLLWSYEDFAGTPHLNSDTLVGDRATVMRNLHRVFPEASIIVGVRDPGSWQRSLYRESVRQGSPLTWAEFEHDFDRSALDHEHYVAALSEVFPRVHRYRFEELIEDPRSVVQGICDFLDVPMPDVQLVSTNEALSPRRLRVLRALNRAVRSEAYNPRGFLHPGATLLLEPLRRRHRYR